MTAHYSSKNGQVLKTPQELYMSFCDMSNFTRMIPEKYKKEIEVSGDYDSLCVTARGFRIGVRVEERRPYSLIRLNSYDSPVEFVCTLNFDQSIMAGRTDFCIVADANLNFMMKTMLGGKVQDVLDKIVDGLVDASEGKMPQMPDIPGDLH